MRVLSTFGDRVRYHHDHKEEMRGIALSLLIQFGMGTISTELMLSSSRNGTDFFYTAQGRVIMYRVRQNIRRSPTLFTLRTKHKFNDPPEADRIFFEQFGDWYLYCTTRNDQLARWMMLDLHVFRRHVCSVRPLVDEENDDGTRYVEFDALDFPDRFIIAKSF
jgi:hypothetical protein